jgi:putative transposase
VVAWDVAEREDPAIAADLVSRTCLLERISKGRSQPLILHADNGNALRTTAQESRLEELGMLRSFSRPRDQVHDAPPAPQWRCCGDLPSPGCRL